MRRPTQKNAAKQSQISQSRRPSSVSAKHVNGTPISADEQPLGENSMTVYTPPSDEVIEQFTQEVCEALVQKGRTEFASPRVRWQIANFLKLIAELTSKQMSTP